MYPTTVISLKWTVGQASRNASSIEISRGVIVGERISLYNYAGLFAPTRAFIKSIAPLPTGILYPKERGKT